MREEIRKNGALKKKMCLSWIWREPKPASYFLLAELSVPIEIGIEHFSVGGGIFVYFFCCRKK